MKNIVNWYLKSPHIYLENENCSIIEVSSTEVRDILELSGGYCRGLLDPKVESYIRENKLYNCG